MVKGKGAKYANGNYKNQQKAYNNTKYGRGLITRAVEADRKSKKDGTGKKGDNKDNAHVGKNRTVLTSEYQNRAGKGVHKRRKPRK